MSKKNRRARVAIKYCGSCNPRVDISRITRQLKALETRGDFQLVPLSEDDIDLAVIICGCPRACGNKAEFRARAKETLVICGDVVNGRNVPESELPLAVEQELGKILTEF